MEKKKVENFIKGFKGEEEEDQEPESLYNKILKKARSVVTEPGTYSEEKKKKMKKERDDGK